MSAPHAAVHRGLAGLHSEWDRLAQRASLISSRRFLATVDGASAFRVEVTDRERLRAAAPGWIADGSGHAFLEPSRLLAELGVGGGRHVMVGTPWGFAAEILADDGDTGAIAALFDALLDHADCVAARGVIALYLDDRSLDLLSAEHVAPALVSYDAVIEAEGWLARLPRHRRGCVRAEQRAFARAGLRITVEADLGSIAELVPILCMSEARHGHPIDAEVLRNALVGQRERLGDAFRIFAARDGSGRMVAGATAFVDRTALHMRMCGVDRELARDAYEYFHVAYYGPLAHAAELGCTRVHLGMESFEAKLLRGARLEPRWAAELGGSSPWDRARLRRWNLAKLAELDALLDRFPDAVTAERRAALDRRVAAA